MVTVPERIFAPNRMPYGRGFYIPHLLFRDCPLPDNLLRIQPHVLYLAFHVPYLAP